MFWLRSQLAVFRKAVHRVLANRSKRKLTLESERIWRTVIGQGLGLLVH